MAVSLGAFSSEIWRSLLLAGWVLVAAPLMIRFGNWWQGTLAKPPLSEKDVRFARFGSYALAISFVAQGVFRAIYK